MTATAIEPMLQPKILGLLQQQKRVNWISQAWNVPRPHIIQLGLDNGLHYRPRDDIMTAAPQALDITDETKVPQLDAKGRPLAPAPRPDEIPPHLLPPQRVQADGEPGDDNIDDEIDESDDDIELELEDEIDEDAENPANTIPTKATTAPSFETLSRPDNLARKAAYFARVQALGTTPAAIREWARAHGRIVGYIPGGILDAYEAAHVTPAAIPAADDHLPEIVDGAADNPAPEIANPQVNASPPDEKPDTPSDDEPDGQRSIVHEPSTDDDAIISIDQLLARAWLIDNPRVHAAARAVQGAAVILTDVLAEALRALDLEAARQRFEEAEAAAAQAKNDYLRIKAAIDGSTSTHAIAALSDLGEAMRRAGTNSTAVRAWAMANDIDCPGRGSVPRHVFDAWCRANPDNERTPA